MIDKGETPLENKTADDQKWYSIKYHWYKCIKPLRHVLMTGLQHRWSESINEYYQHSSLLFKFLWFICCQFALTLSKVPQLELDYLFSILKFVKDRKVSGYLLGEQLLTDVKALSKIRLR